MVSALDTPIPDLWGLTVVVLEDLGYPFDDLAQTEAEYLADVATDLTGVPYSNLSSSFLELVEVVHNELVDPNLSRSTSTLAELLAGIANSTGGGEPAPGAGSFYFGPMFFGDLMGRYFGMASGAEPEAVILLSASTIAEDAAIDDVVGTLSVTGATGTPVFALDDDAGGLFALDGADVVVAGALDFETEPAPQITVSVSGITPAATPVTFTITVTNVAEPGTIVLSASTIAEDAAISAVVGTLSITAGTGTPAFTLDDNAGGLFGLSGANVIVASGLDFETEPAPEITVSVSGVTPSITPVPFTITVTNVAEGYTFTNAEAAAYVAAMGVQPDDTRKAVIDTFVGSLKSASVWAKLDFLYLLASHNSAAALINVKAPGTFNCVAVSSPTHTVDRGYAGNGSTSYLNTQFTPSTAGGVWLLDSAHMGVWSRTNAEISNPVMGATGVGDSLAAKLILRIVTTGNINFRMNQSATGAIAVANGNSSGHFVMRRSASNAQAAFRNAVSLGSNATLSSGRAAVPIFICCFNNNGTAANFVTYQVAAAHGGASLTDQNITDLYAALSTYMTAVGA